MRTRSEPGPRGALVKTNSISRATRVAELDPGEHSAVGQDGRRRVRGPHEALGVLALRRVHPVHRHRLVEERADVGPRPPGGEPAGVGEGLDRQALEELVEKDAGAPRRTKGRGAALVDVLCERLLLGRPRRIAPRAGSRAVPPDQPLPAHARVRRQTRPACDWRSARGGRCSRSSRSALERRDERALHVARPDAGSASEAGTRRTSSTEKDRSDVATSSATRRFTRS